MQGPFRAFSIRLYNRSTVFRIRLLSVQIRPFHLLQWLSDHDDCSCCGFPDNPQGCIDADRAIGPGNKADKHDEREILRRFAAKEMKGAAGKENGCQRIDTTMDALGNTIGCELSYVSVRRWVRVFSRTRSKMTTASFME